MRGIPAVLLAIDTSTRTVGLALYNGAQVLNETVWTSSDYHTVELAPAVHNAIERSGVPMAALEAIAVATGPGSFTGLRVGLALAKGLVMARGLALVGIPSLDALAEAQPPADGPLLAVLRAGRGRWALQEYTWSKGWRSKGDPAIATIEGLAERIGAHTTICGELDEEERHRLAGNQPPARLASAARSLRRPSFLAELGWKRWRAGKTDSPASLAPVYIHFNDPIPV